MVKGPLLPRSPTQVEIYNRIRLYLRDYLHFMQEEEIAEVALQVWRLTREEKK